MPQMSKQCMNKVAATAQKSTPLTKNRSDAAPARPLNFHLQNFEGRIEEAANGRD